MNTLWQGDNVSFIQNEGDLVDIGTIGMLMMNSGFYARQQFGQLQERVVNHVLLNQYGLLMEGTVPVGFGLWGFLAPACANIYKDQIRPLHRTELNSGSTCWFMDVSAPMGHQKEIVEALYTYHQTSGKAFSLKWRNNKPQVRTHDLKNQPKSWDDANKQME